jgi:hypothetical protein
VEAADSHTRQRNTCYDSHRQGEGKAGGFRIASLKLFPETKAEHNASNLLSTMIHAAQPGRSS